MERYADRSPRRLRWRIERGTYTAIDGSPSFTPLAVLWREMYVRLPERAEDEHGRHPEAGSPVTRGMAHYLLDEAMSHFDERPDRAVLQAAVDEIAQRRGDRFPTLGFSLLEGYEALDRLDGRLTAWTEGLVHRNRSQRRAAKDVADDERNNDPTRSGGHAYIQTNAEARRVCRTRSDFSSAFRWGWQLAGQAYGGEGGEALKD